MLTSGMLRAGHSDATKLNGGCKLSAQPYQNKYNPFKPTRTDWCSVVIITLRAVTVKCGAGGLPFEKSDNW